MLPLVSRTAEGLARWLAVLWLAAAASVPSCPEPDMVDALIETFISRGDLADLALFLWAAGASAAAALLLREVSAANRRFDAFVRELQHFNSRHERADQSRPRE
ncbi:MAG: hypothetical protein U1E62_13015 [Alsobacter sp.]